MIHAQPIEFLEISMLQVGVVNFICNDFTRVCVPLFFAISGFLLFAGLNDYTGEVYLRKLRSRIRSILIPYLIWNAVVFVLFTTKTILTQGFSTSYIIDNIIKAFIGKFPGGDSSIFEPYNVPFDFPLWFIRNLFVYILISPVFYWIIKRIGKIFIVVCCLIFILGQWPKVIFLNINGIVFFSIGAYLAIHKLDPAEIINKHESFFKMLVPIYFVLVILDAISFVLWGNLYFYFHSAQIFIGFFVIYYLFQLFSYRHPSYKPLISGEAVFALYLIHGIVDNYLSKLESSFGSFGVMSNLSFFLFDFIGMIVISLAIYRLIKNLSPSVAAVVFGGRYDRFVG